MMEEENSKRSLFSLLGHPFPEAQGFRVQVKYIAFVALFVTLFLYILQPFQLDRAEGMQLKLSIYFGLITFFASLVYDSFIVKVIGVQKYGTKYTLLKWIIITLGMIVFIGVCNFLFMYYWYQIPLQGLLSMIISTLFIGVFPLVYIGTISMLKQEKKYEGIAKLINSEKEILSKETKETKLIFGIDSDKVLYLESLQNYVNIFYLKNDKVEKRTERATLKSCEEMVQETTLIKCHRSYIVNKAKIVDVAGNAQGLKLSFDEVDDVVPVSRNYISIFRA